MNEKKWVATIRDNRWTVAKIECNKMRINICQLKEFNHYEIQNVDSHIDSITEDSMEMALSNDPSGQNSEELILALKNWLKQNKIPVKKLSFALSCPGVITRVITIPVLSDKDLEKLLTEQVDQYFTFNISDYLIDYRILQKVTEKEQERYRILLVAIPLTEWEKQWHIWSALGFTPKVTDLNADCLARLYSRLIAKNHTGQETLEDLAIVDIGADRVEFLLLDQGVVFLYSDMEISLEEIHKLAAEFNSFTEESRDAYENYISQADEESQMLLENESKKQQVHEETIEDSGFVVEKGGYQEEPLKLDDSGLHESTGDYSFENEQSRRLEVYQNEIEDRLFPIFNALHDYLTFFSTRHFGKSVDKIFITGEESNIPFIETLFEKNMGIETKRGFPNQWRPTYKKRFFKKKVTSISDEQLSNYGSLYGLAMRDD